MKLPDTHVLIYAANAQAAQHRGAKAWLVAAYADPAGIGFAWPALIGFLRLTTRQGILARPLRIDDALGLVHDWLAHPRAQVLQTGANHEAVLAALLRSLGSAGNLVSDAHLAALAIEHQCELHSNDSDFARFPGLRWRNPL